MRASLLLAACLGLATAPVGRAIVIYGTTGLDHSADPGGGLPWANVGALNGATGVYLGVFGGVPWALTAAHVGAGTLTLESGAFAAGGSAIVIRNPDNSPTDLAAFPLSTTPTLLPNLSLASAPPAAGTTAFLIGNGRKENGPLRFWNGQWTEQSADQNAVYSGYELAPGGKRWGQATYFGSGTYSIPNATTQIGVGTVFEPIAGKSQAAPGDSGGVIFFKNGSSWELLGIISTIATFTNQPADTSVVQNFTLGVSLPVYQSALLAAIPEPGHYALGAGALSLLAVLWHRHRSQGRR